VSRSQTYRNTHFSGQKSAFFSRESPQSSLRSTKWAVYGSLHKDASGRYTRPVDAESKDIPNLPDHRNNSSQIFESTALALEGPQKDTTYGSVQWGWKRDGGGSFSKLPFTIKTIGVPTATFQRAAEIWNNTKTSTGADVIKIPVVHALQPTPGTEVKEVEDALRTTPPDYASAFQILNGQWIKPMLPTLSALNKNGHLPSLYSNFDQAIGIDTDRLRTVIEAVQYKENKIPLSQGFYDWIDPTKNSRIGEINEIKAFIGLK
jgi:hypothetical protein